MMNKLAAMALTCLLGSWSLQSEASLMGVTLDSTPQIFNFTIGTTPPNPPGLTFVEPDFWRVNFSSLPNPGSLLMTVFSDLNGGGTQFSSTPELVTTNPFTCLAGVDCAAAPGGFSIALSFFPDISGPQTFTVDLSGTFQDGEVPRDAIVTPLSEVPAPAPLGLLSLGAILLFRRLRATR